MTDDQLRELGKHVPWDRPDAARRDAARSALLVAAEASPPHARRRWLVTTVTFTAGALAAAAIALVVLRDPAPQIDLPNPAQITASSEARFEHHVVATTTGVDEIVQLHDGKIRIGAEHARPGDRVRLQTRDAEVEGAGVYEATVTADSLSTVSVRSGTAAIKVIGQRTVTLSAGQTWRASIITTDLTPDLAKPTAVASADVPPSHSTDSVQSIDPVATTQPTTGSLTTTQPSARSTTASPPSTVTTTTQPSTTTTTQPATGRASTQPSITTAPGTGRASTQTTTTQPSTGTTTARSSTTQPTSRTATTQPSTTDPAKPADYADTLSGVRGSNKAVVRDADKPSGIQPADAALHPVGKPDVASSTGAPSKRAASPIEKRFQSGWSLLKQGKAREAASELGAAADASPADPLAVDARYFQAVALVRAGERTEAERVLVKFLDNAPKSLRRGRAAVLLGRLIGDRGDLSSARAWLESAVTDPDPDIASAAKAGLQALDKKQR